MRFNSPVFARFMAWSNTIEASITTSWSREYIQQSSGHRCQILPIQPMEDTGFETGRILDVDVPWTQVVPTSRVRHQ
jgi:hypothetical protein